MATDKRKSDHIGLTEKAQSDVSLLDTRFDYEPLFGDHKDKSLEFTFLGKKLGAPLWISSMTGGVNGADQINATLAKAASHFRLGMGLGSCRPLLKNEKKYFDQFNVRPILGEDLPLYANLGIAQIEKLLAQGEGKKIERLVKLLSCDGLIVHINPLQEWFQPEGDRFQAPPIETLTRLFNECDLKVIVKEVGQGFGPKSLHALLEMPLVAIEFAAFGGTNFSKLECLRDQAEEKKNSSSLCFVGHSTIEMIDEINRLLPKLEGAGKLRASKEFIISGGVNSFLDGYHLTSRIDANSCYGQASKMLSGALRGADYLINQIEGELAGLMMAKSFLKVRREKM